MTTTTPEQTNVGAPVAPVKLERWQDLVQQKSPEELWYDLQNARFWFRLTATAAFIASLFFSVSYFCGGNLSPTEWDGENWGNAGLAVLITGAITIWQYKLYLVRSSHATKATLFAAALAAFFGVFTEVSHSLSREDASVEHRSQSSPVFQALLQQVQGAGTIAPASTGFESEIAKAKTELATANMKLARCKANVESGKWKDCLESTARVDGINAKIASLNDMASERVNGQIQAQQAQTLSLVDKAKAMEYDEDKHYGMIKVLKKLFGVESLIASLIFSLIVMGTFEYAFHWQGTYTADLEYALRSLGYNTGKFKKRPNERLEQFQRKAKAFNEAVMPKLDKSGVMPSGYGFKMNPTPPPEFNGNPAMAVNNMAVTSGKPSLNDADKIRQIKEVKAEIERLKQLKAEQEAAAPESVPAPPEKRQIGFIDTNEKKSSVQGTHEHQYSMYLGKALDTGKANSEEEVKRFIDKVKAEKLANSPAGKTGLGTGTETGMDTGRVRLKTGSDTGRVRSESPESKPVQEAAKPVADVLTDDAKQVAVSLYPEWVKRVRAKEIKAGRRDGQKFISQQTKSGSKAVGITIIEMQRIWQVWQRKAAKDGVLKINPKYSPDKTGVAKYILA